MDVNDLMRQINAEQPDTQELCNAAVEAVVGVLSAYRSGLLAHGFPPDQVSAMVFMLSSMMWENAIFRRHDED